MFEGFGEFMLAVFRSWLEWVGMVLSIIPFLEKLPNVRDWLENRPLLEKFVPLLWVLGSVCVFCGFFSAWRGEHEKVRSQQAYLEFRGDEVWIQENIPWQADRPGIFNIGIENVTPYPALEESYIGEIIYRKLPIPLGALMVGGTSPTTPDREDDVWNEMLNDQKEISRHPTRTFDPWEKWWSGIRTRYPLTHEEVNRQTAAIDVFYVVALVKWKDGLGVHVKSACYWLNPANPQTGPRVFEQCDTHNDYIPDATQYLWAFQHHRSGAK